MTIYGKNLGIEPDDVKDGIRVGNVPCTGLVEEYEQPNKYVCGIVSIIYCLPCSLVYVLLLA